MERLGLNTRNPTNQRELTRRRGGRGTAKKEDPRASSAGWPRNPTRDEVKKEAAGDE